MIYRNIYMIAEILIFSITTIYFYRKMNSMSGQIKEMETKIQNLEKTITEQKTFINDKMSEMSSIVSSQINQLMQQSRPQYPHPQQYTQSPQYDQVPPYTTSTPPKVNVQPQKLFQATQNQQTQKNVQGSQNSQSSQNVQASQNQQNFQTTPTRQNVQASHTQQNEENQQNVQPVQNQNGQISQKLPSSPIQPPSQFFPFEVLVFSEGDMKTKNDNKMTIEEDIDEDDLDRDLGPELSELN